MARKAAAGKTVGMSCELYPLTRMKDPAVQDKSAGKGVGNKILVHIHWLRKYAGKRVYCFCLGTKTELFRTVDLFDARAIAFSNLTDVMLTYSKPGLVHVG